MIFLRVAPSQRTALISSPFPDSSTYRALHIPEIRLKIFYNSTPSDLVSVARPCRDFNAEATSALYSNLQLQWRFTKVDPLLRSFRLNPHLYSLVRSLAVTAFKEKDLRSLARKSS